MLRPDSQPLTRCETGHGSRVTSSNLCLRSGIVAVTCSNLCLQSGIVAAAGKQLPMAAMHATDFQAFLSQKFLPGSKWGTSGVYYEKFRDKVRAAIKDPSSADKNVRYYVKKNNFQLLDLDMVYSWADII